MPALNGHSFAAAAEAENANRLAAQHRLDLPLHMQSLSAAASQLQQQLAQVHLQWMLRLQEGQKTSLRRHQTMR